MQKVQVTKEMLIESLNEGMSRKEIAANCGVPVSQLNIIMEMAGLKGFKPKKPMMIELVDSITVVQEEAPVEVAEVMEMESITEGMYSIND